MSAKPKIEGYDPKELARFEMDRCDGDVIAATDALEALARRDMGAWQSLTDALLRQACYDQVRALCRAERRKIWTTTGYDAGGNGERVVRHSNSILDFPLPGGKKLRDATKEDLATASQMYRKQAEQMSAIAMWMDRVAAKVKGKRTVEECLSEDQINKLRQ